MNASGSAARITAMNAIANEYKKLPHKTIEADASALLAFIQKDRKSFSAAGIYDGQVWAEFSDGTFLAISNSEIEIPTKKKPAGGDPYALPAPREASLRQQFTADGYGAPRAYVLGNAAAYGTSTIQVLRDIATALQDVGYNVTFAEATVDQLKAVQDAHVLVINTHGGTMPAHIPGGVHEIRQAGYALVTTTPITSGNDAKYASDIADGSVYYGMSGYYNLTTRRPELTETYNVSPEFFEKYVTFQNGALDNSLAFFATCLSASPDVVQPFLKVLQDKGLIAYLGWTKMTTHIDDLTAAAEFIDRTLPEDITQNVIPVQHETPPQSASTVTDTYDWMEKAGLTWSSTPGNVSLPPTDSGALSTLLLYVKPSPGVPQLAPILNQVTLFEYNKDQPGTPWIEGQGAWGAPEKSGDVVWGISSDPLGSIKPFPAPLSGYSGEGQLRSTLPASATNGYIRLFEDGISSNAVPLTEWDGTIAVEEKQTVGGNFDGSVTLKAALRVSLHEAINPMRAKIDGPLTWPPAYFTDFMPNSNGFLSGDGSYSSIYGGSPAVYKSTHEDAVVGSNQNAPKGDAVFDAALPGGSYTHTCGSVVNDLATACLAIGGSGDNVATCSGGTPASGNGSICPAGYQPSPVQWAFNTYGYCGTSGAYIPFTVSHTNYALSVPSSFNCPSGYAGPPAPPGLVSEKTTFTFKFGAPKSPPTSQTATGNSRTR
jgi:hypothetical protein